MIIFQRVAAALTIFINISPLMASFPDRTGDQARPAPAARAACREKIMQICAQVDKAYREAQETVGRMTQGTLEHYMKVVPQVEESDEAAQLKILKDLRTQDLNAQERIALGFNMALLRTQQALPLLQDEKATAQTYQLQELYNQADLHLRKRLQDLPAKIQWANARKREAEDVLRKVAQEEVRQQLKSEQRM